MVEAAMTDKMKKSVKYLCDDLKENYSAHGTDKNQVCSLLKQNISKLDFKSTIPTAYALFIPATNQIQLSPSFNLSNLQHVGSELIHEGQHMHWNANKRDGEGTLENEFNSHKLQAYFMLYSDAKNVDSSYLDSPAVGLFDDKIEQLLKEENGNLRVKADNANEYDSVYYEVCKRYYKNVGYLQQWVKDKCVKDYFYMPN